MCCGEVKRAMGFGGVLGGWLVNKKRKKNSRHTLCTRTVLGLVFYLPGRFTCCRSVSMLTRRFGCFVELMVNSGGNYFPSPTRRPSHSWFRRGRSYRCHCRPDASLQPLETNYQCTPVDFVKITRTFSLCIPNVSHTLSFRLSRRSWRCNPLVINSFKMNSSGKCRSGNTMSFEN